MISFAVVRGRETVANFGPETAVSALVSFVLASRLFDYCYYYSRQFQLILLPGIYGRTYTVENDDQHEATR